MQDTEPADMMRLWVAQLERMLENVTKNYQAIVVLTPR
jgi:hypothetical protein